MEFSQEVTGFMSIRSVFNAAGALIQGHRQGLIQASTLQLGGAIVIDISGEVRYFFAESKAGDHPNVDELLGAV